MDRTVPSFNPLVPAYLWIGDRHNLVTHTITWLQTIFCTHKGCLHCAICKQIADRQYYGALWLQPEKHAYTLDQLEPLFKAISFQLDDQQHMFFIVQMAERLSDGCAHALLKSIEEPPPGYHFIFLASSQDGVLPTIQSRAIIWHERSSINTHEHPMLTFFTTENADPLLFFQTVQTLEIDIQETYQILNTLLNKSITHYKQAATQSNKDRIEQLLTIMKKPIMPGSDRLLWQHLFLLFHT